MPTEQINDYILFYRDDEWDAKGRYEKLTLSEDDFKSIYPKLKVKPTAVIVIKNGKMYRIA
ncbi:MAG: hypothetical protein LIR50_11940 [Bacillota bacterium]|nr:hypothetical protein [Bacillota bacterium]